MLGGEQIQGSLCDDLELALLGRPILCPRAPGVSLLSGPRAGLGANSAHPCPQEPEADSLTPIVAL